MGMGGLVGTQVLRLGWQVKKSSQRGGDGYEMKVKMAGTICGGQI